ncbi:acetyl-coenzyme a synthetase [Russula earlei]|uniref:Acetyl-coenzyme a synthetase n=1 Tax=Russula earlei TaxID=71964 RepID=A0ACC0U819_9AGAM|nr:acetyl-coenzyme a synthetase [Russula earlei]
MSEPIPIHPVAPRLKDGPKKPHTAIIYEADEPNEGREITYAELLDEVSRVANVLKSLGIKKGDTVSIYLPMAWQAVAALLACARIGAIHSVVFAGFSAEALRGRIDDCQSRVVITADEGRRGGKTIATKEIVDSALKSCPYVEHVLVLRRTGNKVPWTQGRDKWWHEETARVPNECAPEVLSAEDPLFILYTSGSTGKPKGVVHTQAGYLLGVNLTLKYVFDVHPDDSQPPSIPTPSRYWQVVDKHKLTHFYTAPTAIRLLRRLGSEHVGGHDLSSLRVIGTVGEPINPEAWNWYNENVGRRQCAVVDTYWQTETGSIIITPFPGAIETKPGSATVPFFGIDPVILDPKTGKELPGNNVEGLLVLRNPWPSIARTVFQDHQRYLETYMKPYAGYFYTGDGAARDEHGYIWIKGRVDDVINVSGHRLSTAEIESALILHPGVAEAAVIGAADDLTGQAVYAFPTLKPLADPSVSSNSRPALARSDFKYDRDDESGLSKELVLQVRKAIGPFAAPKKIYIVNDLPKTRSGKIMRRILRKIVAGEGDQLGDLSTLAEPAVVDQIKVKVAQSA